MSIASRPSLLHHTIARRAIRSWNAAVHDFRFTLRRVPPLLSIVVLAAVLVATSAFLLFKASITPPATEIKASKATNSNLAEKTTNVKAEPDLPPNWTVLEPAYKSFKIQVGNDNSLQTDKHAVELYGIKILPRSQICTYQSRERWACGQRTYIALLNILGAATVDCRPKQKNQPHIVVCHLGGKDIAELMLREGWATPANGVTDQNYIAAAATASSTKSGMWSLRASRSMNVPVN